MMILERKKLKEQRNVLLNYADTLFKDKVLIKSQQQFRSDHHSLSLHRRS